jgi:hypothetical protein
MISWSMDGKGVYREEHSEGPVSPAWLAGLSSCSPTKTVWRSSPPSGQLRFNEILSRRTCQSPMTLALEHP